MIHLTSQPPTPSKGNADGRILDPLEARNLLASATMIIGFHPDQATEAVIDMALLLRVSFIVCPVGFIFYIKNFNLKFYI